MHKDHQHDNSAENHPEQEGSDATDDNIGNLIPFPRISPETTRSPITGSDWRVERIDTEPMTDERYRAAVTALAALIVEWEQEQQNTKHADNNIDEIS